MRDLRLSGVPKKSLGQHFLTDARLAAQIAELAAHSPSIPVIEIGAGLGDLTRELARRTDLVIAIEKDDALAARLVRQFHGTHVRIVHADALEVDMEAMLREAGANAPYTVVGNLPYNIAQPLLRHVLESQPPAQQVVVMVQLEVAESIVGGPGAMTLLGLSVQLHGEPEIVLRVPPSAFYPPPKVSSAVVRINVRREGTRSAVDEAALFEVAHAGFGTKRKQLRNALAHGLAMEPKAVEALLLEVGIDHSRRAQELSIDEWHALAKAWSPVRRSRRE